VTGPARPARPARTPSARDVAARVLVRVAKDAAFAAASLDAELARHVQLEPRDRALATELVYGSLRVQPWLLARLGRFTPRGIDSVEVHVRAQLLVAAYQLFFTRLPAFAAVSETVSAVKAERGERVAAFANAVLRKVAHLAGQTTDEERADAIGASIPAWIREGLERALGDEGARSFVRAGREAPPIALRVEDAASREAWIRTIAAAAPGASVEPGRTSPRAILVRGAGKPQALPGWTEGAWTVQEEGSQLAALAVGAREGETVLDACAGRGNKAGVLARAVGAAGAVDACDVSPAKLVRLGEELGRLGLHARGAFAVDWTGGSGEVTGAYDRVLVDAPCTGMGTLRRRPEIALRRDSADLASKTRDQVAILARAAEHVRPGGVLVYVVCSVLREEAEDVVEAALRARPELAPAPFEAPEARAIAGDAHSLRLLPDVHGTDGYFVALMRRRT
jgi:16S rRNA (cytosine967-C5)-methyltransferase